MNIMKRLIFFSSLIAVFLFTSCSDDDKSGASSSGGGDLVGTWSMDLFGSIGSSVYGDGDAAYMQFQKDGTYISVDQDGSDIKISFGTYKRKSANKIVVTVDEEESDVEYRISDNKLYLSLPVSGILTTYVLTYVDNNVMDKYFTKHNMKDYLKQYEVNFDQYKVNLDQYKVDLNQYKVDIEKYRINLTPNIIETGSSCPDSKHPHEIDMGEAGKWACCNVGASSPEEFGEYYAWGETEEKYYFDDTTYKYYDISSDSYKYLGDDIAGTSYDVAQVKWGGKWKMPSLKRINLLLNKCSSEWCEHNLYGDANIENCYNINGKIYRIENAYSYNLVNDIVYNFDNVYDFDYYYLINGKTYKIVNINDYYFINDKIYKLDNVSNYYTVDGKIYNINNSKGYYLNGNDLYIIPSGDVSGLESFSAQKIQTNGSLSSQGQAIYKISESFNNRRLINKINGRIFTSKNGNKIFLPAAGYRSLYYTDEVGSSSYYWSSTQFPSDYRRAHSLSILSDYVSAERNGYRYNGHTVRPVTD